MTNERKQRILCAVTDDKGEYYYNGPLDGIWGPESQKAAERFVKDFSDDDTLETDSAGTGKGTFWEEIRYFSREEFRCQCGGKYCDGFPAEPDETLVRLVNDLRAQAGRPAHRSSGLRCAVWNKIQGGVANSKHMYGKALDFYIEGVSGDALLAMAQADPRTSYAYKIEGQYVHVDVQ